MLGQIFPDSLSVPWPQQAPQVVARGPALPQRVDLEVRTRGPPPWGGGEWGAVGRI